MLLVQPSRALSFFVPKFNLAASISKFCSSLSFLLSLCKTPSLLHQIHTRFIIHGHHQNSSICFNLISLYNNLGFIDLSIKVFVSIDEPDKHLCSTIFKILSSHRMWETTLIIFRQILAKCILSQETPYLCAINACSNLSSIETGLQIHALVEKLWLEAHADVCTSLVSMYGRHGAVNDAHKVFDNMPVRTLAGWNEVIFATAEHGEGNRCFRLFNRLRSEGFEPDSTTIIGILRSCVDFNSLKLGRCVHLLILIYNFVYNCSVMTTLLTMYCKLGDLETAGLLFENMAFKDRAVWNVMISGYSQHMHLMQALTLLKSMSESGLRPDLFTAIASVSVVTQLKSLVHGKQIHGVVIRHEADCQISVHNSLIEMYSQCGCPTKSRIVFDCLETKTMASWSSMIKGYVTNKLLLKSLLLFKHMGTCGVRADSIAIVNVLPACASSGLLEMVRTMFSFSIKQGFNLMVSINTAFLVSFAKCGCIKMAQSIFYEGDVKCKDIVCWNSMIGAYSKHGDWFQSFQLYKNLKESGVLPDEVTFQALLSACVNSGLVKEGWECFCEMIDKFGVRPSHEHYACMVDLLGRSGKLEEAVIFIERLPFKADVRVWGPLLSACKLHVEMRVAEFTAWKLIELEKGNAANYVLLSNIYAAAGNWEGVAKTRNLLKGSGLKKIPGFSWLEINGQVHEFRVMDQTHPESESIYGMLKIMEHEIKFDKGMD
ncbi:Pentatricopeptide repeat-containing protein [Platanthera guangdongensis]|uniref:Pentatricopeptide repeat-containing protein n=1 Tax=Platanthera guangdongensis TaxID=2320717 RepID=A0ABR2MMN9_9ASPA